MSKMVDNTKSILHKLFSTGFFHVFGSGVINKIIAFLSSVVLVRILTKTEYGTFTYAWNIYSIVLIFSGMGMESAMLQLASEHGGEYEYTDKVSKYCTWFGLQFNMILAIVLLGVGFEAPLKIQRGRILIIALCLLPFVQLIVSLMSCYLRAVKRNQDYAKLTIVNTIAIFAGSVGGTLLFRELGLVIGYYTAAIVTCLFGHYVLRVSLIKRETSNMGDDRKTLLRIGFISMINNGLSQLLLLLDVFVLGIVDPQETILAGYKVATMIPTALIFIPNSLVIYIYPYFAKNKNDGKWCIYHFKKIIIVLGIVNSLMSLLLFGFAPTIISVVYGNQYLDSVPILRVLSVNYFISGTFRIVSGNLLVTQRKLKYNLMESIITSIINVIADYYFIQLWGGMGAAIATLMVVIISSIMSTTYLILTFVRLKSPT